MDPSWAQIQPGPSLGPGDPETDPDPAPDPDELSGPNQGPPSTRPGKKIRRSGYPRCDFGVRASSYVGPFTVQ